MSRKKRKEKEIKKNIRKDTQSKSHDGILDRYWRIKKSINTTSLATWQKNNSFNEDDHVLPLWIFII